MDLRGIANGISSTVNPNTTVTVLKSTGYIIGAGCKQVPTYADPLTGPAQIQAATSDDLKQLDGLNIQGTVKTIFFRGALAGVVRPNQGGDLVQIKDPITGAVLETWLVVKVLEGWHTWTKAAICLQGDV